jgi:photosystem II stability/assembly factor-like uncharacterized protein
MKKFLIFLKLLLLVNLGFSQSLSWLVEANKPESNFFEIQKKYSKKMDELYKKNDPALLLTKISKILPNNNPESPSYEAVKYKRWEWFWMNRVNTDGSFPSASQRYNMLQEVTEKHAQDKKSNTEFFVDSAISANWIDISRKTNDGGYNGMGLTSAVAFHPTDANQFWVSADVGGVWKTTNGGASYTPIGDNLPFLGIGLIVVDRTNVNNIIVTTGNEVGNYYTGYSVGLARTTDGGTSWTTVLPNSQLDGVFYHTLVQDPVNAGTFYACSNKNFLISTDGGATWRQRYSTASGTTAYQISPKDANVSYGLFSGDLYKSTDGGLNFTFLRNFASPSDVRVNIALSPTDVNRIVVYTNYLGGRNFTFGSTDGGETWRAMATLPDGAPYPGLISFSPTDPNILYGGVADVFRSNNFGASWTRITSYCCGSGPDFINAGDGNRTEVHPDTRNILINPLSNLIYFCNDGGLDSYNETTNKWKRLSNGLVIPQYYSVASSETNVNVISVGSQDNGGSKRRSDGTWFVTNGGDAGTQLIDPTNENIFYTHYNPKFAIIRSTDNGASYTQVRPSGDLMSNSWVIPMVLKPGSPNTIYVGYKEVFRSDNRGDTWVKISPVISSSKPLAISEIAVAPSNTNYIYAANFDRLYKTTTGNTSGWTNVTRSGPITGIAIKDDAPATIYICQGGYIAGQKVFKSTNGGTSFTNISAGLPNIVINDILYQKGSNEFLYVATDFGVYYKTATMTSWAKYGTGLPTLVVNQLSPQYSAGKLRAATFGRGVWETDLLSTGTITPPPNTTLASGIYTIVNRNSGLVLDVPGASTADNVGILQYKANGANNQKYQVTALGAGEYSIKPLHSLTLNKGFDMPGGTVADGAQVVQFGYSGGANQKWKIISVGAGYYQIQNVNSAKSLVVEGGSVANDARIIQFTYNGTSNEQWQFVATTVNIAVTTEAPTANIALQDLSVSPVPAKDNAKVTYNNKDNAQTAIVSVLNQYGAIVSQQKWQLAKGANSTNINTQKLASGTYYVNVYGTTSKQHKKVTIIVIK